MNCKPCKNCDRLMRPDKALKADYPGTVSYCGQGFCYTCYQRLAPPKVRTKCPPECRVCERALRPANTLIAVYPGTVEHQAGGLCAACHTREQNGESAVIDEAPDPHTVAGLEAFLRARERRREEMRLRDARIAQAAAQARFTQHRRAA